MLEVTLHGSSNVEHRLQVLSDLCKQAEEKCNHIDRSRQTNLNLALVIFAGLFGLGIGLQNSANRAYISAVISIVMFLFCLWDRRLHKIGHGWRSAASALYKSITQVINNPDQDVTFSRYRPEGEKKAEWFSFQPMIYYALVLGGLISFVAFPLLSIP